MSVAGDLNPFPGLRPFEPDEDFLFFGREEELDALLARLRKSRFVAVVGTSGSGKSSLVRSGLIPSLHSGYMTRAGSSWRVAVFRPGEDPIGHLARALDHPDVLGDDDEDDDEIGLELLETTLRASAVGLVDAVRQARIRERDNVLVVVDQFEELFRFKESRRVDNARAEALAFVKLLLEAARRDDVKVYVVITMRSDFIGSCMEFPGLPEAVNEGQFLVPRMTRDGLRRAITGPVAVGGGAIAPRLTLRLLNEIGDDPDQLPILQHALRRSWDYWRAHRRNGGPLDLDHYEAVGTMEAALSEHAEEAYVELDGERQREIAERLFKALTDKISDRRGVRRPCRLDEVCAVAGATPAEVSAVVDVFRRPGRSFLMPPHGVALGRDSILDISHESLMRVWGRLRDWADEEARSGDFYQRLSRAAALHEAGEAALWRDPELELGLLWSKENQPTATWAERYDPHFERAMAFLEESRRQRDLEVERRERERLAKLRRARWLAAIFFVLALVMVGIGLYALDAKRRADEQKQIAEARQLEAEAARQEAEAKQREADEQRQEAKRQETEAKRQEAEAKRQEAEAKRQEAEADQQRRIALDNERLAREQEAAARRAEEEAQVERRNALSQKEIADENAKLAREQEEKASRLRVQALARALAVQAPQLTGAPELPALLAAASYRLAEQSDANPEATEVHEALRRTLQRLAPERAVMRDPRSAVRALAVSGDAVIFGTEGGAVRRAGGETLGTLDTRVRSLAVDAGGRWRVAGGFDGTLYVWDRERRGAPPRALPAHQGSVDALAFLPDGSLVSGGADGEVRRTDVAASAAGDSLTSAGGRVRSLAVDGAGKRLAVATDAGARLVDLERPEQASTACAGAIRSVAFGRGGRLACGGADGTVTVRAVDGSARTLTPGHATAVHALRFNPRRDQLASAGADGTVRLWDLARPDEPLVLEEHEGWVWALAFSDDGDRLYSGSEDRTIRVWRTRAALLVDDVCRQVSRDLTREEWDENVGEIDYEPVCSGEKEVKP